MLRHVGQGRQHERGARVVPLTEGAQIRDTQVGPLVDEADDLVECLPPLAAACHAECLAGRRGDEQCRPKLGRVNGRGLEHIPDIVEPRAHTVRLAARDRFGHEFYAVLVDAEALARHTPAGTGEEVDGGDGGGHRVTRSMRASISGQ